MSLAEKLGHWWNRQIVFGLDLDSGPARVSLNESVKIGEEMSPQEQIQIQIYLPMIINDQGAIVRHPVELRVATFNAYNGHDYPFGGDLKDLDLGILLLQEGLPLEIADLVSRGWTVLGYGQRRIVHREGLQVEGHVIAPAPNCGDDLRDYQAVRVPLGDGSFLHLVNAHLCHRTDSRGSDLDHFAEFIRGLQGAPIVVGLDANARRELIIGELNARGIDIRQAECVGNCGPVGQRGPVDHLLVIGGGLEIRDPARISLGRSDHTMVLGDIHLTNVTERVCVPEPVEMPPYYLVSP